MDALPQSRGSRLTYDNGTLEITVPLEAHEFLGRLIERFILTLVELMGMRIKTMGSTTMNYPQLQKGAEPDNAYSIQNQPLPNLIEEIESLGQQQRQELRSRLSVLIGHLLKWHYQPQQRSRSWLATLRIQCLDIAELLEDNPSLKS
ncbi:MAG: DUF29 family protein [Cyanobacteria bacterium CRU_2_1]|nr:DUF29 family protein [Cyanobacteria bacterium RU_5_0]NJR62468.1 DUF29 family protein [Cyanobacteria bacterium CRU_2_1]